MARNGANADELAVTMPVEDSALVRLYPDYFTKILGLPFYIPFNDTYFPSAPMVWSSWTSYYEAVTEAENVAAVVFSNSGTIAKFNRMGLLAGFGSRRLRLVRHSLEPPRQGH